MSARYPPRSCHESNPADLIEDDVIDVTIRGIARFQLSSLAIGAISNPSVSARGAVRMVGAVLWQDR
jgi:hypothetical protein